MQDKLEITTIGQIIDLDPAVFEDTYFTPERSIVEMSGLKKLLELEYVRVEKMKNEIIHRLKIGALKEGESKDTVAQMYAILQRIEDKATILYKHIQIAREEKKKMKNR